MWGLGGGEEERRTPKIFGGRWGALFDCQEGGKKETPHKHVIYHLRKEGGKILEN